jgi:hypothetical protein
MDEDANHPAFTSVHDEPVCKTIETQWLKNQNMDDCRWIGSLSLNARHDLFCMYNHAVE